MGEGFARPTLIKKLRQYVRATCRRVGSPADPGASSRLRWKVICGKRWSDKTAFNRIFIFLKNSWLEQKVRTMGNRHPQPSPGWRLPFEVVLMIAKCVSENDPHRCPHHGILRRQRGDLRSLSRVNKLFRQACINSGLFANFRPHRIRSRTEAANFLTTLFIVHQAYSQITRVDSLCIDLTAPKTWFFLSPHPRILSRCARVMLAGCAGYPEGTA